VSVKTCADAAAAAAQGTHPPSLAPRIVPLYVRLLLSSELVVRLQWLLTALQRRRPNALRGK